MDENDEVVYAINSLDISNFMYFVFIVACLLVIYGNQQLKRSYFYDQNGRFSARKIYIFAAILVLFIFLYFVYRNYTNLYKYPYADVHQFQLAKSRVIGSILLVVGQLILLNYLLKIDIVRGSPL